MIHITACWYLEWQGSSFYCTAQLIQPDQASCSSKPPPTSSVSCWSLSRSARQAGEPQLNATRAGQSGMNLAALKNSCHLPLPGDCRSASAGSRFSHAVSVCWSQKGSSYSRMTYGMAGTVEMTVCTQETQYKGACRYVCAWNAAATRHARVIHALVVQIHSVFIRVPCCSNAHASNPLRCTAPGVALQDSSCNNAYMPAGWHLADYPMADIVELHTAQNVHSASVAITCLHSAAACCTLSSVVKVQGFGDNHLQQHLCASLQLQHGPTSAHLVQQAHTKAAYCSQLCSWQGWVEE